MQYQPLRRSSAKHIRRLSGYKDLQISISPIDYLFKLSVRVRVYYSSVKSFRLMYLHPSPALGFQKHPFRQPKTNHTNIPPFKILLAHNPSTSKFQSLRKNLHRMACPNRSKRVRQSQVSKQSIPVHTSIPSQDFVQSQPEAKMMCWLQCCSCMMMEVGCHSSRRSFLLTSFRSWSRIKARS